MSASETGESPFRFASSTITRTPYSAFVENIIATNPTGGVGDAGCLLVGVQRGQRVLAIPEPADLHDLPVSKGEDRGHSNVRLEAVGLPGVVTCRPQDLVPAFGDLVGLHVVVVPGLHPLLGESEHPLLAVERRGV